MTLSGGSIYFARLEPGDYQLRLLGLPDPIQTVTLTESDPVQTNVILRCPRQPTLNRALWCQLQFDGPYVLELLQAGADASFQPPETGYTTLMAANELTPKNARALLEAGAEVNRTNHAGQTALMFAVERWSPEVVQLLLEAGAKLDVTNQEGRTPLDLAVWEGREDLAETLRALGAPGRLSQSKPQGGIRGTVRDDAGAPLAGVLVDCRLVDGDVQAMCGGMTGKDGRYSFQELKLGTYEVHLGLGDEVRKMVTLSNRNETVDGVDIRIPGAGGLDWRLLHFSSYRDGSIANLLKQGADPNVQDPEDGETPLQNAASVSLPRDIQVLLKAGARVDTTNRWGRTALMIAARREQLRNVELLLKAGADIHRVDHMNCSALHLACEKGNRNIAMRLVEAGADLQATNREAEPRWTRPYGKAMPNSPRPCAPRGHRGRSTSPSPAAASVASPWMKTEIRCAAFPFSFNGRRRVAERVGRARRSCERRRMEPLHCGNWSPVAIGSHRHRGWSPP